MFLITGTVYTMTSSNVNIFRVTGSLWGESTGHRCLRCSAVEVRKLMNNYISLKTMHVIQAQNSTFLYQIPVEQIIGHGWVITIQSSQMNFITIEMPRDEPKEWAISSRIIDDRLLWNKILI